MTHLATLLGENDSRQTEASGRRIREFQCREIAHAIKYLKRKAGVSRKPLETVVMGDFNCEPGAMELSSLRQIGLTCVYDALHLPYPRTQLPSGKCVDHAWISPALSCLSVLTKRAGASDHRAVIVQLSARSPDA